MELDGERSSVSLNIDETTSTEKIKIASRGTGNSLSIGKNCRISGYFFLANGASLVIGENVTSTGPLTFHLHEGSKVTIGDRCLFSQNVVFRPSDAHKIIDLETGERINPPKPIIVGEEVWVGEQVLLLKGAVIGKGSIVGARSTVTSDLSAGGGGENVLIVGSPARIIRRGVGWQP